MKTIIFVCHGNICRSPCAEVIANTLIKKNNLENKYRVFSRALSYEEYGNDIYPPMKRVLNAHNHVYDRHHADILKEDEVINADIIYYMDKSNYSLIKWKFEKYLSKFHLLTEKTTNKDIEDPWYTDRFELVYSEIEEAINSIIS